MQNDTQLDLGAWSSDDLLRTAKTVPIDGVDAGLPHGTRFLTSVAKAIDRRKLRPESVNDSPLPAVFFLGTAPVELATVTHIRILNNGRHNLSGSVWFVNVGATKGMRYDYGEQETEDLLASLSEKYGLGSRPAVVFDPQEPDIIRWFENGIDDFDGSREIAITHHPVSLAEIFSIIDKVHKDFLIVPEAQDKQLAPLWVDAARGVAVLNAERSVQHYLRIGLAGAFITCNVRAEQPMPVGRSDIEIDRPNPLDPTTVHRYAILELKVFKSFTTNGRKITHGKNDSVVKWGVRQAARYEKYKPAIGKALCCFDMRVPPDVKHCFDNVRNDANSRGVNLAAWPVYNSTVALDADS